MGDTNNNNNSNTEGSWVKTLTPSGNGDGALPICLPSPIARFRFVCTPTNEKFSSGGTKTIQFSLHWQKCNIHLYMQCTCVNIFLGLLTHVPFPSFWSASLFSIFRHCDRQTFLLQTLLLLFMVLCANWENKRIRGSAIQFAFVDFLHIHCLGGNGNVTLICCCYFSGLVVLVLWFALLYSHSRSSF